MQPWGGKTCPTREFLNTHELDASIELFKLPYLRYQPGRVGTTEQVPLVGGLLWTLVS